MRSLILNALAWLRSGYLCLRIWVCMLIILCAPFALCSETALIRVGSKAFAEGYLLGELLSQKLERDGFAVERKLGLGKTIITYQALANNEIDVYVEYSGTLTQAILKKPEWMQTALTQEKLNNALEPLQLEVLKPLGFNNTYALVMSENAMRERGIQRISDLANHPDLALSLSHEFINRPDGWPGLKARYQLPQTVAGIEHSLAYQAIQTNTIELTDAYSTDGDIARYGLKLLADDLNYFPEYKALPFVSQALEPSAKESINALAGLLNETVMQQMNAKALEQDQSYAQVAKAFLDQQFGSQDTSAIPTHWSMLWTYIKEHLWLTLTALISACVLGIGVGILCYSSVQLSRVLVYSTGLMQTIPSLALLALLIPIFGIGWVPAVIALFIYSLLPIVRSTLTSLSTIEPLFVEVAEGLGLSRQQQLLRVYLPMALPGILTGVKTAAIISIGTATLASFIGAGGLGDPIITGLSLNDHQLVLLGAIPAALLAIIVELLFEWLESRLIPAHMRGRKAVSNS
jgi:osmoprotectant transport system permease protein